MAGDLTAVFDKWVDLVKDFAQLNADFAKEVLTTVQGGVGKAELRFNVPRTLNGLSGHQNNRAIPLPGVAKGNIAAPAGFQNVVGGSSITSARLVVEELTDRPNVYRFQLNNIAADNPAVGKYIGVIVNTANMEVIAPVVIEVV